MPRTNRQTRKEPYNISRAYWPTTKTFQPNGNRETIRRINQIMSGQLEFWSNEHGCICKWRCFRSGKWYLAAKPYVKVIDMPISDQGK